MERTKECGGRCGELSPGSPCPAGRIHKCTTFRLTRSSNERNWPSGKGFSILVCTGECSTFLDYFPGSVKFGLGDANSAAAAQRGIKVRAINRDILRDGTDLLADELFSSDFTAALNGQFDGFHSGFPCSSFSRARLLPGGPPPVRNRQHLRWCPSNSRVQSKEVRTVLLGGRSGDCVAQRRSRIQRILVKTHTRAPGCCPH